TIVRFWALQTTMILSTCSRLDLNACFTSCVPKVTALKIGLRTILLCFLSE
ncbi:hypothetical protein MKX03_001703, partial [Papaver bracteatum]